MCTGLTQLCLLVEYKVFFLHNVQLHFSALDNGHLQVVHKIHYIVPINIFVLDEYTHSKFVTSSVSSGFDVIGESIYMCVT